MSNDLRQPASPFTLAAHAEVAAELPSDDPQDWLDARFGLVAPLPEGGIKSEDGTRQVWNIDRFQAFQQQDAACPDTVNPSLWRVARLNAIAGLFQVCPGVHQVRGLDLSNITLIEGANGRIVIDPLISFETARAALDLADQHLGPRPITGLIYTHSHVDHFGGSEAVKARAVPDVPIIAPDGFMTYAVSENLHAGNAMRRRASYMYGPLLPADARGLVDAGLGKTTSGGRVGLVVPTHAITFSGERMVIDGIEIEFHLAPNSEAPAEMMVYLPHLKLVNIADVACQCQHNLYTLRGAEVRDARAWAHALDTAALGFAAEADALCAGHQWPRFGAPRIVEFLENQRDLYKYIHDQTLRLANDGLTPREIAETLKPPQALASQWHLRGYYGTTAHNSKAIYQKYLGWFDGHPANLNPLPPEAAGPLYVQFMGGATQLLENARAAFERGQYRFVAEVLTHLVFAEPGNRAARALQADALEQLGYQAESAPWRNIYLTGAMELRRDDASAPSPLPAPMASPLAALLPVEQIFEGLAVALDGPKADGMVVGINWRFSDGSGNFHMRLKNGVLNFWRDRDAVADATVKLSRTGLAAVLGGRTTFQALVAAGEASAEGNFAALAGLLGLFRRPDPRFNIVLP